MVIENIETENSCQPNVMCRPCLDTDPYKRIAKNTILSQIGHRLLDIINKFYFILCNNVFIFLGPSWLEIHSSIYE